MRAASLAVQRAGWKPGALRWEAARSASLGPCSVLTCTGRAALAPDALQFLGTGSRWAPAGRCGWEGVGAAGR